MVEVRGLMDLINFLVFILFIGFGKNVGIVIWIFGGSLLNLLFFGLYFMIVDIILDFFCRFFKVDKFFFIIDFICFIFFKCFIKMF